MANRWGNSDRLFFGAPKSLQMVITAMKLKDTCSLEETHFRLKDTYRLKMRGWENIFHANGKQKKAIVAILISDKIDV